MILKSFECFDQALQVDIWENNTQKNHPFIIHDGSENGIVSGYP